MAYVNSVHLSIKHAQLCFLGPGQYVTNANLSPQGAVAQKIHYVMFVEDFMDPV